MRTIYDLLDDYLLTHDLADESIDYYRRMVSVLCSWAKRRVPLKSFTTDLVNRLLLDKQRCGLSGSYRRSLRNALRALLAYHAGGPITGKLRRVRVDDLVIEVWTAAEVQRLIDTCAYMRDPAKRQWWKTLIAAGYYTGFSNGDLWKLRPDQIDDAGRVFIYRSRTHKPVTRSIPEPWLSQIRAMAQGRRFVWGLSTTTQVFQATFRRIAKRAGLKGTFKKLRKSCGTSVEMTFPGRGHIALGNTRQVFEKHYFSRKQLDENPMAPDELPSPEPPKAA